VQPSRKRKGRYESCNDFSEIEVSRRSSYDFAQKAASAVGLCQKAAEGLALFRPMAGSRIPNEEIIILTEMEF
jgi:hypothetical protein